MRHLQREVAEATRASRERLALEGSAMTQHYVGRAVGISEEIVSVVALNAAFWGQTPAAISSRVLPGAGFLWLPFFVVPCAFATWHPTGITVLGIVTLAAAG
jgi:hypothetical protein